MESQCMCAVKFIVLKVKNDVWKIIISSDTFRETNAIGMDLNEIILAMNHV